MLSALLASAITALVAYFLGERSHGIEARGLLLDRYANLFAAVGRYEVHRRGRSSFYSGSRFDNVAAIIRETGEASASALAEVELEAALQAVLLREDDEDFRAAAVDLVAFAKNPKGDEFAEDLVARLSERLRQRGRPLELPA